LAVSALKSSKLNRRVYDGDEIITVAACFPTTVAPIIQNNLVPVFVDVELSTYNIDINQIEEAITDKTKGIFIAHTLGNPFNLEKITEIAEKYNLWLIEDNCDSLSSKYNDKLTGTYGHISTYSFYPAHHITMGEGGAISTDDNTLYSILLSLRDWGRDCYCKPGHDNTCGMRFNRKFGTLPFGYDHKYIYSHFGYDLKITDWQAAIGLAQLEKLDKFTQKRKKNFKLLINGLKKFSRYLILPTHEENADPSWFGFILTLKENNKYDLIDLLRFLEENKIGTRQLFAGNILRQPLFADSHYKIKIGKNEFYCDELKEKDMVSLKNTEIISKNTFWIGLWPKIGDEEINRIISTFEKFFI
jgi:CDP-6-deoxy-D-xylo-4-hexulose-3-dehydrase